MARLVCILWLLCSGWTWASLPRQPAQRYGDFTFAATNFSLFNGTNTFTSIAQKPGAGNLTNTDICNLPSSISLAYDLNGNLTSDGARFFAYDTENRLLTNWVAGSWKTEFVYDGLGRRRIERDYGWQDGWVKTNEVHFLYDGWLLMQVRDGSNNVLVTYTRGLDLSRSLAGAGGIGGLLARTDGSGSTFYHADGAGNITGLMDGQGNMAARYMYGPFGKLTGRWGPLADVNEIQFASMPRLVNSGLSLFPFRAYDPAIQRWIQRDPIEESGGVNLYQFAWNVPLNVLDPYGLDNWWTGFGDAIVGAFGGNAYIGSLRTSGQQDLDNMTRRLVPDAISYSDWDRSWRESHNLKTGTDTSGGWAGGAVQAVANLTGGAGELYLAAAMSRVPGAGASTRAVRCNRSLAKGAGAAEAPEELVGIRSYKELSELTKGFEGELQAHHLLEARHLRAAGFTEEQIAESPAIILTRAEHAQVGQALETALPTGQRYSMRTVLKEYEQAYAGHPDWVLAIRTWLKQQ